MRVPSSARRPAVVAIPAHDEAERIIPCLAALAMQRDGTGAPLPSGGFDVLVLANNCRDGTAAAARAFASVAPFPLHVVECCLPPVEAHAGGARRAAMDRAADLLDAGGDRGGIILTTDADSCATPTWVAATLAGFVPGIDAVFGYIDADPSEYLALGAGFVRRGRLEDRYLSRVAEVYALLDPRRHDPWPNHRVHSGAALAVTLSAYRAIGGLPVRPLGEDSALAEVLEQSGYRIRHSMEAVVTTSCRFDSRAAGGAGDTMRVRHQDLDAPCDGDMEPTDRLFRRARARGQLRRLHAAGRLGETLAWRRRLGLDRPAAAALAAEAAGRPFAPLWRRVEAESPVLAFGEPLRPSALPGQIDAIERLLLRLRCARLPAEVSAGLAATFPDASPFDAEPLISVRSLNRPNPGGPADIPVPAEPRSDDIAARRP